MQLKKQTQSYTQTEIDKKQSNEYFLHWRQPNFTPELYSTPKITNTMRQFYDQFFKTKRVQFRPNTQGGQSKWIFKTELKVVSQPIPENLSQDLNKNTKLSRIKAFNKLSEREWQRESLRFNNNKKMYQQLVRSYEFQKEKRIKFKKKMVYIFMKKMKINFLTKKLNQVDDCINQLNEHITSTQQNIKYLRAAIQETQHTSFKLRSEIKIKQLQVDRQNKQIAIKVEKLKANDQKIREISMKRLPNQKQIVNCMFSIGIINQQLYVLQLKKNLKKQISLSQLQLKKIKKQQKLQQSTLKGSFSKEFSECISHRKIKVDCHNSEIIIFKVFTVIYMHCKSLYLKNIASIMSKTSYFSEDFKQIYDFPQFEKYMVNLIERFKGNEILLGLQQKQPIDCIENTLTIVADESQFNFLNWVLKTFHLMAEGTYCIRIRKNKTLINLITKSKLSELPRRQKSSSLRIKFNALNKTSVFY